MTGIIELGLPILFLPHTTTETLTIPNRPALDVLPSTWSGAAGTKARTSLLLPPTGWFEAHAGDVRRRLRALPGSGTFEFAVMQVLHQLGSVCHQIAHFAGRNTTSTPEDIGSLFWDLHARSFRGIVLGVAALAWHCLGFDPGCPRRMAMKALKDLRAKGPMSRSDILRSAHLKKEERDVMLERFAAEDLVRVDGKTVSLQKWRAIKHPLKVGELESITVNANLKISSKVRRSPFNCSTVCETPCSNSPLPFAAPPRLYSQRDRRHGRVPRSRRPPSLACLCKEQLPPVSSPTNKDCVR